MKELMRRSIKSGSKAKRKWEGLVGYDLDQLKEHLEERFKPGMNWSNYGKWHIDHVIPRAAFSYKTPDDLDFKRCWALGNLQPLWAVENQRKYVSLPGL